MLWINAGRVPLLDPDPADAPACCSRSKDFFSRGSLTEAGLPSGRHGFAPRSPRPIAGYDPRSERSPAVAFFRIIPAHDETYAVNEADFVGHVAVVTIGPLDQGLPGRVRPQGCLRPTCISVPARASPRLESAGGLAPSVLLVDPRH